LSPVVAALMNLDSVEDIPDDDELEALKGKRITATIGKTPGGYAKLSGAAPARRKKKSRPAAAPAASVFDADDDDEERLATESVCISRSSRESLPARFIGAQYVRTH